MNLSAVLRLIRRECDKAGSARAWAASIGVSGVYVADVLAGRRDPGPAILRALGVERVVSYRRVG